MSCCSGPVSKTSSECCEDQMALDTYTFHPVRVKSTEEGNYKAKNSHRKATKCSNLCKIFFRLCIILSIVLCLAMFMAIITSLTSGRENCGQEILGICSFRILVTLSVNHSQPDWSLSLFFESLVQRFPHGMIIDNFL